MLFSLPFQSIKLFNCLQVNMESSLCVRSGYVECQYHDERDQFYSLFLMVILYFFEELFDL